MSDWWPAGIVVVAVAVSAAMHVIHNRRTVTLMRGVLEGERAVFESIRAEVAAHKAMADTFEAITARAEEAVKGLNL